MANGTVRTGGNNIYCGHRAGEETKDARIKAKKLGIKKIYIEDLREDFVKNYVYPMFRSNAIYEGEYFLGTSIARPLISKRLIEIAKKKRQIIFVMGQLVRVTIKLDLN